MRTLLRFLIVSFASFLGFIGLSIAYDASTFEEIIGGLLLALFMVIFGYLANGILKSYENQYGSVLRHEPADSDRFRRAAVSYLQIRAGLIRGGALLLIVVGLSWSALCWYYPPFDLGETLLFAAMGLFAPVAFAYRTYRRYLHITRALEFASTSPLLEALVILYTVFNGRATDPLAVAAQKSISALPEYPQIAAAMAVRSAGRT